MSKAQLTLQFILTTVTILATSGTSQGCVAQYQNGDNSQVILGDEHTIYIGPSIPTNYNPLTGLHRFGSRVSQYKTSVANCRGSRQLLFAIPKSGSLPNSFICGGIRFEAKHSESDLLFSLKGIKSIAVLATCNIFQSGQCSSSLRSKRSDFQYGFLYTPSMGIYNIRIGPSPSQSGDFTLVSSCGLLQDHR